MTPDLFIALAAFAFATVASPGPNNLMLMASGANYGLRRSLPHMTGIGLGFPAMVVLVGLGVMQVFEAWPPARDLLRAACASFLLWLAWKIATAAPPGQAKAQGRPLRFWQAAAFQWVNPKAWTMALSAITLYAPGRDLPAVLWVAGVYVAVSVLSTTLWTLAGTQIARLLTSPTRLRAFNWGMALALIAAVLPALVAG